VTEKVTETKGAMEIRHLIDQRLKARASDESAVPADAHLDDDAICAFVEGRLVETEAAPLISHLILCSSCRHATALLLRVESQFKPEDDPTPDESPGRVGLLLERLAAGFTPSLEEDAVFAYQDPEPDRNAESVGQEPPEKPEDAR
jgi:hypothetical protein